VARVKEPAREHNCTPGQLALAWVLRRGPDVVPIPGTKRRRYLEENVEATEVSLSAEDEDSDFTLIAELHVTLPETDVEVAKDVVRVAHMASGKDVKTRYKSTETRPVQLNWPRLDVIRWKYQAVWLSRNDFFIRQAMRPAIPTPSIARGLGRGTLVVATPSMPTVKPYQFSKTGVVQLSEV